jgi:type IX secretion system PorP/SprF family membrane protein
MLAFDSPLLGDKMGVGFSMVHDVIGVSRDLQFDADYSYHLRTGETGRLALGLKAGLSVYSARLSDLTYWDGNDEVFANDISNKLIGKFGFGAYWWNDLSYVGLSVPTLYAADDAITADVQGTLEHYFTRHYYLYAGHVFHLNEFFDLKPSGMVKMEPSAPLEADINLNVLYKEKLWLGVGYRTGDSFVAMTEYKVSPLLRVGYAYDLTVSELNAYSRGSHEVMLGMDLGTEPIKVKTPRYF